MARIRADFVFGTTTAGIDDDDTTLASAELARLPAVASPHYAVLTLHDAGTGDYEIVYVTAHTASATSATITRGEEGSTAQSWASDAKWVHGPTALDATSGVLGIPTLVGVSTPHYATNNTSTVNLPTGLEDGDILVGFTASKDASLWGSGAPGGWKLLARTTNTWGDSAVLVRSALATDSGDPAVFTFDNNCTHSAHVAAIRGATLADFGAYTTINTDVGSVQPDGLRGGKAILGFHASYAGGATLTGPNTALSSIDEAGHESAMYLEVRDFGVGSILMSNSPATKMAYAALVMQ